MKKLIMAFAFSAMFIGVQAFENGNKPIKKESVVDGQQVRFYNECSSSVDFYVKGSGGTTRYTVSSKSSKNVSVSVGDKILDSSRNEIVEVSSSTSKVVVCE
jgi:hypothetical protein